MRLTLAGLAIATFILSAEARAGAVFPGVSGRLESNASRTLSSWEVRVDLECVPVAPSTDSDSCGSAVGRGQVSPSGTFSIPPVTLGRSLKANETEKLTVLFYHEGQRSLSIGPLNPAQPGIMARLLESLKRLTVVAIPEVEVELYRAHAGPQGFEGWLGEFLRGKSDTEIRFIVRPAEPGQIPKELQYSFMELFAEPLAKTARFPKSIKECLFPFPMAELPSKASLAFEISYVDLESPSHAFRRIFLDEFPLNALSPGPWKFKVPVDHL